MKSSIISCLNPQIITNRYTKEVLQVPCGHCLLCQLKKADSLSSRVEDESKQHRYTMFFTLTYDNKHLPVYIEKNGKLIPNPDDVRLKDYPIYDIDDYFTPLKWSKKNCCFDSTNKYTIKCFGVLSSVDVCNFKKRLRINLVRLINKYEKTKKYSQKDLPLRLIVVGEYGPKTFRPHYHALAWYDDELVHRFFKAALYKSWKMCRPYELLKSASLVKSNAGRYVAGYLNFYSDLPGTLQQKPLAPFRRASKSPAIGFYRSQEKEIIKSFLFGNMQTSRIDYETLSIVPAEFPSYYLYKWFPKCKGFSVLSPRERYAIYSSCYPAYQREYQRIHSTGDLTFFPSLEKFGSLPGNLYSPQNIRASKVALEICEKYNISLEYYIYRLSLLYDYHIPLAKLAYQYEQLSQLDYKGNKDYIPYYPLSFVSAIKKNRLSVEQFRSVKRSLRYLGLSHSPYIDSINLSVRRKSAFSFKDTPAYNNAVSACRAEYIKRINHKMHNDVLTSTLIN